MTTRFERFRTPEFQADYRNLVLAARNRRPPRYPLYEHIISEEVMEAILGVRFAALAEGDERDRREYMRHYVRFFREMGYDTVSFERLVSAILPGSGALYAHAPGCISTREDCARYPWGELTERFFDAYQTDYRLLSEELPPGMKAVGGPGNGVFECVQDLVGYEKLCYIAADEPRLYGELFRRVGGALAAIWERFLPRFGEAYAVCRMGDDLGFRSGTLLSPADISTHILPQYRRVVALAHQHGKPFLLHSCGNIFAVMPEIIASGIDAKHSNEDAIAPFAVWLQRYGERIGNFGGVDTDVLCQLPERGIRRYVRELVDEAEGHGGVAFGSGNSIPEYVPPEGYLAMVSEVRNLRGDFAAPLPPHGSS
jgi:uroporphyrinogen decarboxylase